MGTWSASSFGNDTAMDWVSDLVGQTDGPAFLAATLSRIGTAPAESSEAEEAIAAATIVASASTHPVGAAPPEAKRWISTSGFAPDVSLLNEALRACTAVRDASELRDLWEEAGNLKAWLAQIAKLTSRLEQSRAEGAVTRSPKPAGAPRSLAGILKLFESKPEARLRAQLREQFKRLPDPNLPSAATGYVPPLALAARYGLLEEVLELLERGADPNSSSGQRPFVAACAKGHLDVARALQKAGAHVFHEHRWSPEHGIAVPVPIDDPTAPPQGHRYCLALFSVAREGMPAAADFLRSIGADIRQTDLNGETLLHKAAESGRLPMLAYLIDAGLDPNQVKGACGDAPLHYAARADQVDAIRLLLERGADPNVVARSEGEEQQWAETPLDVADLDEIKKLLVARGARSASDLPRSRKG